MLEVEPTGAACGAVVRGVDFSRPVEAGTVAAVRRAWLEHHVLVFPEQSLGHEDMVRFGEYFGPIGDDPYFKPIDGHDRIAAIYRGPEETGRVFADSFHSDWSFQVVPPSGSFLYGITIPPVGGDTNFSNQHLALEAMPPEMRARFDGLVGLHSARGAYANDGRYAAENYSGGMAIRTSDSANAVHGHPIVRDHPETGRPGLFGGSYVFAFEGLPEAESRERVKELSAWQARPEFIYRHVWQPGMLVLWDNRSVLHQATGGYEGHERLLHRLTVADDAGYHLPDARPRLSA